MPDVILVHGLWYRSWSLGRLKRLLTDAGHNVHTFSYPTLRKAPQDNAASLLDFCRSNSSTGFHLVGHSLGGLVILNMLHMDHGLSPGRVVFLGTPLAGSLVAQRLSKTGPGRHLLGQAGPSLAEGFARLPAGLEYGMIAGILGRGLGRLTGPFDGPGDGTVALHETSSEMLKDRIELKVSHTGLLFSGEVARQTALFINQGRFAPQD